eukprot:862360-Rhodomonas_salina.9
MMLVIGMLCQRPPVVGATKQQGTAFEDQMELLMKWGGVGEQSKRVQEVLDIMEKMEKRRFESSETKESALLDAIQEKQRLFEVENTHMDTVERDTTSKEPVIEESTDMALEIPKAYENMNSDSLNIWNGLNFPESRMDTYIHELKAKTSKRVNSARGYAKRDENDSENDSDDMYTLSPSQSTPKQARNIPNEDHVLQLIEDLVSDSDENSDDDLSDLDEDDGKISKPVVKSRTKKNATSQKPMKIEET